MDTDLIPAGTKVVVPATLTGTRRLSVIRDDDDAWTAPSSPTSLALDFPSPVTARRLALTFQGGFVATSVVVSTDAGELAKIYPEDVNRRQVFDITSTPAPTNRLTLEMPGSTDNQGRITVYRVELLE